MNKLIEIYEEFEHIKYTYRGDQTDWDAARRSLSGLVERIKYLKIRYSPHRGYYLWVQAKLRAEIEWEYGRVVEITEKQ